MPRYRVTAVERMTGIPASTLRSWERRYGWPRPFRAVSGQRLYSDHDLAVIRFLDRRRVEGRSMSQAAGLLRAAPAADDPDPGRLLERLVAAFRVFDEAAAGHAFAAAGALLGLEAWPSTWSRPPSPRPARPPATTPARRSRSSTSPPTSCAARSCAWSTGCHRPSAGPCWSAAAPTSSTSWAPCC
jgi:DNA-binding transcriptional MerR regulator